MAKAVVFDFDGLIVDTESAIFSIWQNIYESHDVILELDQWIQCVGTQNGFDPYEHLEHLKGRPVDRAEIRDHYESIKYQHTLALPLLPGIQDKITEARKLGCNVAVASGSSQTWVHGHLDHRNLRRHFDHVCTRDDVKQVKPHPELYILAASRLGTSPANCVAFEDSTNGLHSAKAAGFKCVVIPNRVTATSDFSKADMILPSLEHMTLADILNQLKID